LYRIDENRYFEDASEAGRFCENGSPIHYVDKARGIRSYVVNMDGASMGANFIIDAGNDEYLSGPVTRGNTDCSSGGGGCGGARLPYSTDAGRTWKRATPRYSGGYAVYMSGDKVYNSAAWAYMQELAGGMSAWKDGQLSAFPNPVKSPLDTKFHCTDKGKE